MTNTRPTLQPPSIVIEGPTGTGKTYSISTLLENDIETYFIGTEPGACDVLIDACETKKLDLNKLHYHQMDVVAPGWQALMDAANMVKANSYESLSKQTGIAKQQMRHYMELLYTLENFTDDRTGKSYGDVTTKLSNTTALVLDSLSGINKMAREYTVGYKPTMHQGEWGMAMQLEENLIYKLISDRSCFFVLTAHVDRETDEITGGSKITLSALGRKLAPQLIKYFSEVIYTKHESGRFLWSTDEPNVDTKARSLPISSKLDPSFAPIITAYRARLGYAAAPAAPTPSITPQTQGGLALVQTQHTNTTKTNVT